MMDEEDYCTKVICSAAGRGWGTLSEPWWPMHPSLKDVIAFKIEHVNMPVFATPDAQPGYLLKSHKLMSIGSELGYINGNRAAYSFLIPNTESGRLVYNGSQHGTNRWKEVEGSAAPLDSIDFYVTDLANNTMVIGGEWVVSLLIKHSASKHSPSLT
jgi:hypothetical protein